MNTVEIGLVAYGTDWKDLATAPIRKDVLVYCPHGTHHVVVAYLSDAGGTWHAVPGGWTLRPTLWCEFTLPATHRAAVEKIETPELWRS